ncbi:DUF262 domain-containing protein [Calidifontibacter indicus]|uniref:DUF262 domain-containing protein n=1 Tax=Calidifontibacter indicus TaxID=419650 RepID=UPI003D7625B4
MKTSATNRRLRTILTDLREGRLIPDADFQRRLVWSNKHKVAFLETVLNGLPFPEIFIASGDVNTETGVATDLIVDGQQRATTLYQYFSNSPDLKVVGIPTYAALTPEQKREFLEYEVVIRDLGRLNEHDTRDLFYRINSTAYSLNAMEVNNARFDGALKTFCDETSTLSFFIDHQVFSNYDAKRMSDVRWALTLVISMMSTYFNRDSEHEEFLRTYNDALPQDAELRSRLENAFRYVDDSALGEDSRAWQKSDLLTLLVEVDRLLRSGNIRPPAQAGAALRRFYGEVDRVAKGEADVSNRDAHEYFAAARSGTNDRSSRIRRATVVRRILNADEDLASEHPGGTSQFS